MKVDLTTNQVQAIYRSLEDDEKAPHFLRYQIIDRCGELIWSRKRPLTLSLNSFGIEWLEKEISAQIEFFQDIVDVCEGEESSYYSNVINSLKNILEKININPTLPL